MAEISYRRHRFPPVIIQHAVWLYVRFTLSYRDVEELLAERGLDVSYETVRSWVLKFGPIIARRLRRSRPRPSNRWHLDKMVVQITGKHMYLWRAGTVNLSGRVSRMRTTGGEHGGLLPTRATDFGPDLEFLGPGSSMFGGSDVIAAEVKEIIDLIVG